MVKQIVILILLISTPAFGMQRHTYHCARCNNRSFKSSTHCWNTRLEQKKNKLVLNLKSKKMAKTIKKNTIVGQRLLLRFQAKWPIYHSMQVCLNHMGCQVVFLHYSECMLGDHKNYLKKNVRL
jgi:hypothetical protein